MINKFDAFDNILGSGQRPWKYKVSIDLPTPLIKVAGVLYNKTLDILCKAAQIPEITTKVNQVGFDGRLVSIPSVLEFNNTISMTFYVDEASTTRRLMEYWCYCADSAVTSHETTPAYGGSVVSNIVGEALDIGARFVKKATDGVPVVSGLVGGFLGTSGGTSSTSISDITGTITLTLLSYNGTPIASYKLYNAFPTRVSGYQLKDDDTSSISEFEVSFSYTHFSYKNEGSLLDKVINAVF